MNNWTVWGSLKVEGPRPRPRYLPYQLQLRIVPTSAALQLHDAESSNGSKRWINLPCLYMASLVWDERWDSHLQGFIVEVGPMSRQAWEWKPCNRPPGRGEASWVSELNWEAGDSPPPMLPLDPCRSLDVGLNLDIDIIHTNPSTAGLLSAQAQGNSYLTSIQSYFKSTSLSGSLIHFFFF